MAETIQFELNGKKVEMPLDKDQTLLWALRTNFNLTGTKYGCGEGYCGACTVLMNNEAVRSCTIRMEEVAGKKITTIEGLAKNGKLHPVQQAFVDNDALQCGFCTPGMVMNAVGLLEKTPASKLLKAWKTTFAAAVLTCELLMLLNRLPKPYSLT